MFWWLMACREPVVLVPSTTLPVEPGWEVVARLPAPRQECGVVALDGRVVVVGGYGADLAFVDEVWAYDPAVDAWSALPPLPRPAHHPNAVVLDGELHVAGSLVEGFAEWPEHWVLQGDRWADAAPLPDDVAVGASGVAVYDGELHVVGGLHGGVTVPFHLVYDPVADGWTRLPDAPAARDHFVLAAVTDGLVAVAGRADGLDAFTPSSDRWRDGDWEPAAPIPTPRGGVAAAVAVDGRVHVLGGEGNPNDPDGVFGAHEVYDPSTDTWAVNGPMAVPRHGTGAVWLDGALYVPGGAPVLRFDATAHADRWVP